MSEFEKLFINSNIPINAIIEYVEIRIKKSIVLKDQKYEQAAKLRDREKQIIDKYPGLDNDIIKDTGLETLKQQIRNLKIYILLNE